MNFFSRNNNKDNVETTSSHDDSTNLDEDKDIANELDSNEKIVVYFVESNPEVFKDLINKFSSYSVYSFFEEWKKNHFFDVNDPLSHDDFLKIIHSLGYSVKRVEKIVYNTTSMAPRLGETIPFYYIMDLYDTNNKLKVIEFEQIEVLDNSKLNDLQILAFEETFEQAFDYFLDRMERSFKHEHLASFKELLKNYEKILKKIEMVHPSTFSFEEPISTSKSSYNSSLAHYQKITLKNFLRTMEDNFVSFQSYSKMKFYDEYKKYVSQTVDPLNVDNFTISTTRFDDYMNDFGYYVSPYVKNSKNQTYKFYYKGLKLPNTLNHSGKFLDSSSRPDEDYLSNSFIHSYQEKAFCKFLSKMEQSSIKISSYPKTQFYNEYKKYVSSDTEFKSYSNAVLNFFSFELQMKKQGYLISSYVIDKINRRHKYYYKPS